MEVKEDLKFEMNALVQAFSHFSFHFSKGKLVIVDIQGIKNIMTDPAIQSIEQAFGSTDLGTYGIYKFLKNHQCTKYCKLLNLKEISLEIEMMDFEIAKQKGLPNSKEDKNIVKNWKWLSEQNASKKNFSLYKEFNLEIDPLEHELDDYYNDLWERDRSISGEYCDTEAMLNVAARFIIKNNQEDNKFGDLIKDLLVNEFFYDLEKVSEKYQTIKKKKNYLDYLGDI